MPIKETYKVHNPHMTPAAQRVEVRGAQVLATVDTLEVELVNEAGHGTIKLRFVGNDVNAAKELFVNDALIEVSFAAAP